MSEKSEEQVFSAPSAAKAEAAESAAVVSAPSAGPAAETVGDLLRKERLTRRITVETIAKDLKMNAGYIKALEASDYAALPPEPYVRVYVKSLSKYLSLDTESVLTAFDRERGVITDAHDKTANKIDVSVQKQEKSSAFVTITALIVILAVFAYVADKKEWLRDGSAPDDSAAAAVEDTASAPAPDSLSLEAVGDSTIAAISAPPETTVTPPPPPVVKKAPPRQIKAASPSGETPTAPPAMSAP